MGFSKKIKYYRFQTVLFWLLLVSGALKSIFIYIGIDFDLTLMVFVLVLLDILFSLVTRTKKIHLDYNQILFSSLLLVFYVLFFISLLYTPSKVFGYEKTAFFLPCVLSFFYGLFIVQIDLKLLYKLYMILFLPAAIWFLIGKNIYYTPLNRFGFFNDSFLLINTNYLNYGVGIAIMSLLHIQLKKNLLGSFFLLLILLGLGSRGALLFLVLIVLIWKTKSILQFILLNFRIAKKKLPLLLASLSFVLAGGILFGRRITEFIAIGIFRFQSLFEFSKDKSSLERIDMLGFAFDGIFGSAETFLIGNGIGSYGVLFNGLDERAYPHNLFIEAWFELGIVGFLMLLVVLIYPLAQLKNKNLRIFVIIYFFLFLNAMKTGDLVSVWTLYALNGLIIFKVDAKA